MVVRLAKGPWIWAEGVGGMERTEFRGECETWWDLVVLGLSRVLPMIVLGPVNIIGRRAGRTITTHPISDRTLRYSHWIILFRLRHLRV